MGDSAHRLSHQRLDPLTARTGGRRERIPAVVVGLDGSDTSWDAFSWACGETRRLRGRLMAVFATPAVPTFVAAAAFTGVPVCDYTAIDNAAAEQAAHLNAEVQRHLSGQDLEPAFVHARGDPATELLRVAQTVQADVIVVGRSTKLRHPLAGPLGRRLITKRTAPVVVIVP